MPPPDFMVAGERRSGTTSMHRWLSCSPRLALPPAPDSMYFMEEELRGVEDTRVDVDGTQWDAAHSIDEYVARFEGLPSGRPTGEKCADLLYWVPSHARLARYAPDVRLIVTLRDPVTRAWSHYWHEVGKGRETESFETAFERDLDGAHTSDWQRFHLSYARRGFHAESLGRLFETFPKERVFVAILEESRVDPQATIDRIHAFLGVDPATADLPKGPVNRNATSLRRSWVETLHCVPVERACEGAVRRIAGRALRGAPNRWTRVNEITAAVMWPFRSRAANETMAPETEQRLRSLYTPHAAALAELLGRSEPLPWGTR